MKGWQLSSPHFNSSRQMLRLSGWSLRETFLTSIAIIITIIIITAIIIIVIIITKIILVVIIMIPMGISFECVLALC